MREVRFYLFLAGDGPTEIRVVRDPREVVRTGRTHVGGGEGRSVLVHAGVDRPSTEIADGALEDYPGRVLVTAGARWLLPPDVVEGDAPVVEVEETDRLKAMPVYLATGGWGYTCEPPPSRGTEDEGAPESEEAGPSFATLLGTVDAGDPFAVAAIAPPWLARVPIPEVNPGTRVRNAMRAVGVETVGDLARYSLREGERWKGFGGGSQRRLADAIVTASMDRALRERHSGAAPSQDTSRRRTARGRFEDRIADVDARQLDEVLPRLPRWLERVPLSALPVTGRLESAFRLFEGARVDLLEGKTSDDLLAWDGIGAGSVRDLSIALLAAARDPGLQNAYALGPDSWAPWAPGAFAEGGEAPTTDAPRTLLEGLESAWGSPERSRDVAIVKARLGFDGPPLTLAGLADRFGVTRERVRQIVKRALRHVADSPLRGDLEGRLASLLQGRQAPLYADLIAVEDPWFEGVPADVLGRLLDGLENVGAASLTIHHRVAISACSDSWDDLGARALALLQDRLDAGDRLDAEAIATTVEAATAGAPELASTLRAALAPALHVARATGDVAPVLVGIGTSKQRVVEAVLYEAERPLHLDDVLARCRERDPEVGEATVHRGCMEVALRFGHGVYGTERHIPLTDSDQEAVAEAATDAVANGPAGRQWHAAGLLDHLVDELDPVPEGLDKYVLDAILETRTPLISLGRMTWTAAEGVDRIEVMEAAEVLLEDAGEPLAKGELLDAIESYRGVGDAEVLTPTDRVVRVAPGVWGLSDRDAVPRGPHRRLLFRVLEGVLTRRGSGLHESELVGALRGVGASLPEGITGYGLMNLLHLAPALHLYPGQLVGLHSWGEARRATLTEAVQEVAAEVYEPLPMASLIERVQERLGRRAGEETIRGLLARALDYDAARGVYAPVAP